MTPRLTRAEIILLLGVLGLYRDDLLMVETGPEEAAEAEFCGMLLLKLEVMMRDESPGLGADMDFADALRAMKDGKTVRRKGQESWTARIVQVTDSRFEPEIVTDYQGADKLRPFAGSQWDLLAEDWEIAGEP